MQTHTDITYTTFLQGKCQQCFPVKYAQVFKLPAKDKMSVEAASIHPSIFRIDDPACVTCGKVGGCLAPLLWLWTLVGHKETEWRACGDWVLTTRMLLSQVFCYDTAKRIKVKNTCHMPHA